MPQRFNSDHASAFYMYATQAAEVAVDEESGRVRVLRMSAAHDVGKAINPFNCKAQIEGGLAMGIGSALHEELVVDSTGKVRNPSFLDYHLVTSLDVQNIGQVVGGMLSAKWSLACIDEVSLSKLDFIDIGEVVEDEGFVSVVVKRLAFGA